MALVDSEYDPHPAIEVAWLVSGNEGWARQLAHKQGESFQEYVEVPAGIEMEQRVFFNGGVYGKFANPWEDYKQSLSSLTSVYEHPLNELPNPEDSEDVVWMLKKPVLGSDFNEDEPDTWQNYLKNEPVKVKKTRIIGADSSSDPLANHGSYAYWVSDDGLKTKVNIVNPLKVSNAPEDQEVKIAVALDQILEQAQMSFSLVEPRKLKSIKRNMR